MLTSDLARFRETELFDPDSDENTLEQFVKAMSRRRFALTFGRFDGAPGVPWSLSVPPDRVHDFLAGLAVSAQRAELDDCEVAPYWHFLHFGAMH